MKPKLLGLEARIFIAVGHADQSPVTAIAPRVVRACQHLGAAAGSVEDPRSAMTADVGESPHVSVVSANDDHAFAQIFEAAPFPRLGNLAFVADDLRRGSKKRPLLGLQELWLVVEPARKARPV